MCWMCSLNNYPDGVIAKHDYKVYKILKNDGESMFYNYKYNISELQPLININIRSTIGGWVIHEGYHSYIDIRAAKKKLKKYKVIHDFPTFIAEFRIPKGAKFYINSLGEVVSEQIIRIK